MPWWTFGLGRTPRVPRDALTAAYEKALTAAAAPVLRPDSRLLRQQDSWQREVWGFYDTLGEYRYAVAWKGAMLSRVRLFAAELVDGEDEPRRLDSGPAVDLMTRLGGGVAGQAQLMTSFGAQLDVPGEGYLVGEVVDRVERWSVRSTEEVRVRHKRYEVVNEDSPNGDDWRPLSENSHVIRVWRPHQRWYHRADSSSRAARSTMRELELVNRHITAQYLSRLASAGVVIFPTEIEFPVREEFAEANDPFMLEWIEIAAAAIREPGTASAVIPIPIRVPGEYADKIQHLDFTLKIDDKIIEKRDSAIKRLATQVNIPAEVLLGMGDVNHWGQWMIEEAALKTTIAPDAELISQALTTGYLQPRLAASGEQDVGRIVVWYDMSELTLRPDRSGQAFDAYDRLELSGEALRRETGFDESDKPTDAELRDQALKVIIKTLPSGAASALSQLIGEDVAPVIPVSAQAPEVAEASQENLPAAPEGGQSPEPSATPEDRTPPEPDDGAVTARAQRMTRQAQAPHAVRFTMGGRWELLHPSVCEKHAYSCPYTQSALSLKAVARPGRSGLYECTLDTFGRFRVGDAAPQQDVTRFLATQGGGPR